MYSINYTSLKILYLSTCFYQQFISENTCNLPWHFSSDDDYIYIPYSFFYLWSSFFILFYRDIIKIYVAVFLLIREILYFQFSFVKRWSEYALLDSSFIPCLCRSDHLYGEVLIAALIKVCCSHFLVIPNYKVKT